MGADADVYLDKKNLAYPAKSSSVEFESSIKSCWVYVRKSLDEFLFAFTAGKPLSPSPWRDLASQSNVERRKKHQVPGKIW